ncbi:hypothetical protein K8R42_03815 [bacterium]|nr:hypothetical protein [bacterium]
MFKYLIPFINPLILLLGFWLFFYQQKGIVWLVLVSLLVIIISGKVLSRRYFWKYSLLWVNLVLVYISQLLFLLLLSSGVSRYLLSLLLAIIWSVILFLLKRYFQVITNVQITDYLAVNKFFYYLGFWFLSTSLYSLVIFLYFPVIYALLAMLIATLFWSGEIVRAREDIGWLYVVFTSFLMLQIMVVVYFLPIGFYVAGTIATLWFFFIIDSSTSQLKHFRLYLGIFLASITTLLITSII